MYLVEGTEFNGFRNWPLPDKSQEKPESQDTEQPFTGGIPSAHKDNTGVQTPSHRSVPW